MSKTPNHTATVAQSAPRCFDIKARYPKRLFRKIHPFTTGVAEFALGETGALYPTTSFLILTLALSIPLGFVCMRIYFALCDGGRLANTLIGLF